MSDSFERLGSSEIRIKVSVPWSEIEAPYRESLSKLKGTIQVRGFRPGKVPLQIVEKMLGKQIIWDVAVDSIARRVEEIIRRENVTPIKLPIGIEEKTLVDDERNATFDSQMDVLPMIDRVTFDGLKITPRHDVTDDDVVERVRIIGARKAPLETAPNDHPIGEYDQAVLEAKAEYKDGAGGSREMKDYRVDLAPWADQPPALAEQLKGKKSGDSGEVDIMLPAADGDNGPRLAHLSYTVREVIARRIPALDDELAKDFDMKNIEELKGEVRQALDKETLDEYVARNGASIIDQLVDRVSFDLPSGYRKIIEDLKKARGDAGKDAGAGATEGTPAPEKPEAPADGTALAGFYERFMRRNLVTMLVARQNDLTLPAEAMKKASERMRSVIDQQSGSKAEKDEAYERWHREFEQDLFDRLLSSFLVQEAEKAAASGGTDAAPKAEKTEAASATAEGEGTK